MSEGCLLISWLLAPVERGGGGGGGEKGREKEIERERRERGEREERERRERGERREREEREERRLYKRIYIYIISSLLPPAYRERERARARASEGKISGVGTSSKLGPRRTEC